MIAKVGNASTPPDSYFFSQFNPIIKTHGNSASTPAYTLQWRQKQLWVIATEGGYGQKLPPMQEQMHLLECLRHSTIQMICLDPHIGLPAILFWVDTAEQAGKAVYVRLLRGGDRSRKGCLSDHRLYRVFNQIAAVLLLAVLSPLLLGLVVSMQLLNTGEIFHQEWRVGKRGRLFLVWHFSTPERCCFNSRMQSSWVTNFLSTTGLYRLPELINVVKGEMLFVGRQALGLEALTDLSRLNVRRLKSLPGIFSISMHPTSWIA